jgi:heat-inducible transcriptional repressor
VTVEPGDRRYHPPDELDSRARQILRAVIQEYVDTGEPVASNTLARQPGITLSPASVRSVLADLEALGYIDKPHTSAGRIPTDKGFRFYADVLVRLREVAGREKEMIDFHYDPTRGLSTPDVLLPETSRLLHSLTRYAGVVSTPRDGERFRTIEFVRLRENRVLAICILGSGVVKNRLLTVDFAVDQDDLNRASRYLADLLAEARTITEVRSALARELQSDRALYNDMTARALLLGSRAMAEEESPPGVVVEGETSLLGERTFADNVEKLRSLFKALEEKQRLMVLLEQTASAGELTLFIGEETGLQGGEGVAIVAAPIVEYTARALSRTLDEN